MHPIFIDEPLFLEERRLLRKKKHHQEINPDGALVSHLIIN